jgi:hypothetical protein
MTHEGTLADNEIGAALAPQQQATAFAPQQQASSLTAAQDLQFLTNAVAPWLAHPLTLAAAQPLGAPYTEAAESMRSVTLRYQAHFRGLRNAAAPFVNNATPSVRLAALLIYRIGKTLQYKSGVGPQTLSFVRDHVQQILTLASGQQTGPLQE